MATVYIKKNYPKNAFSVHQCTRRMENRFCVFGPVTEGVYGLCVYGLAAGANFKRVQIECECCVAFAVDLQSSTKCLRSMFLLCIFIGISTFIFCRVVFL